MKPSMVSAADARQPVTPAKRILIIASFANVAGAQIAALRVAGGLADRGHDVTARFLYEQVPVNSTDHSYDVLLKTAAPGVSGYLRIARDLYGLIRRERPDVVLTFLPLACVLGQVCAYLARVPRRVVSHRMPINTASALLRSADLVLAWLGIYTRVVCVSRAVLASCRRYPARLLGRTVVVYNGLREFRRSSLTREEARAKFGVPSGKTALVAIGRFVPQKNYPLMMRVVERLDDVVLLVAGDGYLRKDIEADIVTRNLGDKVRLLGNLGRDDVPDLLAAADLFVQTSNYEGQSNTVLEALAAGVPMVVHDVPEQHETIFDPESGETAGSLVPVGNVDAWVKAVEAYRRDPSLGEAARVVAQRRMEVFTYERMIRGFEAAIGA